MNRSKTQPWSQGGFCSTHLSWKAFHQSHSGWETTLVRPPSLLALSFLATILRKLLPLWKASAAFSTYSALLRWDRCFRRYPMQSFLGLWHWFCLRFLWNQNFLQSLHSVMVLIKLHFIALFVFAIFLNYIHFSIERVCAWLCISIIQPNILKQICCATFPPFRNSERYWVSVSLHLVFLPRPIILRPLSYWTEWCCCTGIGPPSWKTFVPAVRLEWMGGIHSNYTLHLIHIPQNRTYANRYRIKKN